MRLRIPLNDSGEAVEWSGKWCDSSAAWSSRLRQMLHYSIGNDGTFWMEYSDFCRHFNKVNKVSDVCHIPQTCNKMLTTVDQMTF